jgi:hypothetical protein
MSQPISNTVPSSVLDTEHQEPKRCTRREIIRGKVMGADPSTVIELGDMSEECGAVATHSVIFTCCDGRVTYACDEHTDTFFEGRPNVCRKCLHRCIPGVCCHRIVTPL